ncbi:polypyrimidine tract-binding protein homolog 1-like [Glycine soja]|uniref:Polypyrimidine tract-binding protein-like 1 n=1 Tax=Glycine soja TaxID=3848 RepID=A0A445I3B6_GLYSO|nr:polypyrimidine tract-binding protein homolog 1-like [Glycine soja]RZB80598.1 Polypyrimidine tract-binding protein-like 1 [Glycine soja]
MACSLRIDEGVSAQTEKQFTVPSKVVHFRNLPKQCSEEELIKLCSPFGKVVNIMSGVGPNRNQGFVEFEDINEANSIVSYYLSSNPVQLRGKTIYVQYSERPELVINKYTKGNILIVTMEGIQAGDVGIDVIHLVFSEFGFVQKISTFEKNACFQAMVQFPDVKTASSAKDALDGKSIPRYLLPNYVCDCNLRITYSAHQDLTIKFQSNRTRDYTNPTLPVNQTSIDRAIQPFENHVLWASFENMQYDVTVDVLHSVFSEYGTVQKISIFEKNGQTHALIQYPDIATATAAKKALMGHCIYDDGCCKLRLSYSHHTDINVKGSSDKSRDYTMPNHGLFEEQVETTDLENPHSTSMSHNSSNSSSAHALQAQVHGGQIPSWNPIHNYMFAPGTFPNQTYAVPPYLVYAVHNESYMEITPPGVPGFSPHMQAGFVGFLPLGVQPYYYGY